VRGLMVVRSVWPSVRVRAVFTLSVCLTGSWQSLTPKCLFKPETQALKMWWGCWKIARLRGGCARPMQ